MLRFSPDLRGLELLHSHRSTLESFGKKVDDKVKSLRAAELLFALKKADFDEAEEVAQEFRANSDRVILLSEGLTHTLLSATHSICMPMSEEEGPALELYSSAIQSDRLRNLAQSIKGRRVSLVLAFHGPPSDRLVWAFRYLLAAIKEKRHPEEANRRVVVTTGQAASKWEMWAQSSPFRTLSFPPRCAGRYLFFSEPLAFFLSLMGQRAWSFVEGGRSFFRQYDKVSETEDPIFAYSALREVQLAEHYRETLVLPDESFRGFGTWWRCLTEDSRRLFAEESNDGIVWTGIVNRELASSNRLHWVTELAVDHQCGEEGELKLDDQNPPPFQREFSDLVALDKVYRDTLDRHRSDGSYAQPCVRLTLRRLDPFCVGALFAFYESVVSTCHRLAETSDQFTLLAPREMDSSEVGV